MKRFYGYCVLLFAAILNGYHCSNLAVVAGNSSSETTNGIMATIYKGDGSPASGAVVRLRRADYASQPPALAKTVIFGADALTDAHGGFQINGIDKGTYSIEVNMLSTGEGQGGAVFFSCSLNVHDTVNFGVDTLRPYAAVLGSIDTSGMSGKLIFVQMLGLERLVAVNSAGRFMLSNLPAGQFSLQVIAVAGSQHTILRTDPVVAISGDTANKILLGWDFTKKLFLNTTASGANVAGNVVNFPVLVRLTGSNFTFSQANIDGSDLRFTKANGQQLPFEVERWDAAGGYAEIWVRIDTIYGNDSAHFISLHWGNPNATGQSSSAAVFDTGKGFQGVWHLGEATGASAPDATENHFDGTSSGTFPVTTSGAVGMCGQFDGTSDYIEISGTASGKLNFPAQSAYTLSAWVYADILDSAYARIIEKNDFQYELQVDWTNNWSFAEYEIAKHFEVTNYPAGTGAWYYLAGVRSGGSQYLFVNGICVDSIVSIVVNTGKRDTTSNVTIGRSALNTIEPPCFFKGKIDEVRIENRALNADRIRLCFMNQKAQDALVVFK
jgi:hypothetical protein